VGMVLGIEFLRVESFPPLALAVGLEIFFIFFSFCFYSVFPDAKVRFSFPFTHQNITQE
jgi:hypothetical protein